MVWKTLNTQIHCIPHEQRAHQEANTSRTTGTHRDHTRHHNPHPKPNRNPRPQHSKTAKLAPRLAQRNIPHRNHRRPRIRRTSTQLGKQSLTANIGRAARRGLNSHPKTYLSTAHTIQDLTVQQLERDWIDKSRTKTNKNPFYTKEIEDGPIIHIPNIKRCEKCNHLFDIDKYMGICTNPWCKHVHEWRYEGD